MSDGNFIFFYNSWDSNGQFHPGFLILDGKQPGNILQRSSSPLLSPDKAWSQGIAPFTCNVPDVIFLEAAYAVPGLTDVFQVFFGGSDATVGTARFSVKISH